jgi:hypothetical protein
MMKKKWMMMMMMKKMMKVPGGNDVEVEDAGLDRYTCMLGLFLLKDGTTEGSSLQSVYVLPVRVVRHELLVKTMETNTGLF